MSSKTGGKIDWRWRLQIQIQRTILTWLGDIGMTEGRTAGEFPDGVPISGRGGMKGVAGSESGMLSGR